MIINYLYEDIKFEKDKIDKKEFLNKDCVNIIDGKKEYYVFNGKFYIVDRKCKNKDKVLYVVSIWDNDKCIFYKTCEYDEMMNIIFDNHKFFLILVEEISLYKNKLVSIEMKKYEIDGKKIFLKNF